MMKRSNFIKTLGLGATGLVLPTSSLIKSKVKIYNNYVKGLQHYHFLEVAYKLKVGDVLQLKRDTKNTYDAFAVAVYFNSYKLGYLPAYENIVIANMLDAKVNLYVQISYFNNQDNDYKMETLGIEVFAELISPTTQLITELQNKRASDAEDIYRKGYNLKL